jgi:hypothetical protein
MNALSLIGMLLVVTAFATASMAQAQPQQVTRAGTAAPEQAAAPCPKRVTKHDHGAERNAHRAPSAECNKEANAASAKVKNEAKPHDHAKFHKNQ